MSLFTHYPHTSYFLYFPSIFTLPLFFFPSFLFTLPLTLFTFLPHSGHPASLLFSLSNTTQGQT
eukprot:TRINITY_DN9764_c0_g1_i1.p4 TRINITY_DN9764_c0_g1~~TRINITY_DN9764_c0_g1_i1.p4  ORF type:complete len:64 (-),score=7.29 TRINITY_DN9764_c0_g1_i1:56-247(-)